MTTPWLTEQEAIAYLRMGGKHPEKVLRRWCRDAGNGRKRLEFAKRGDQYVFLQEWLDAFLMLNGSAGARREVARKAA